MDKIKLAKRVPGIRVTIYQFSISRLPKTNWREFITYYDIDKTTYITKFSGGEYREEIQD